jgi:hypothetical protein
MKETSSLVRWGRGQRLAAALAALALLPALGREAAAANLCIRQNPNSVIFLPRFRAPAKGKCKPCTGVVVNGLPACGASGQACTTPDGTQVLIGLTAFVDGSPVFLEATVPLPIGTSTPILRQSTLSSSSAAATTATLCKAP